MDFKERVPLGRTGFPVSRMGLASGYGVPAAAMERAYHEYGINYFYVSPFLNLGKMIEAVRNLAPRYGDDLVIVLARPLLRGFRLERFVDGWLRKLGLDRVDLLFQGMKHAPDRKLLDRVLRMRERGKIRFLGLSTHRRPMIGELAAGAEGSAVDFCHLRYNAVHTGAEREVFPGLAAENRPGLVSFTATCWGQLLKPKFLPAGEQPVDPVDCYRFVLSRPEVNVCVTGPSSASQMEDNLRALAAGPLDEDEMARLRRIGEAIYRKGSVPILAR